MGLKELAKIVPYMQKNAPKGWIYSAKEGHASTYRQITHVVVDVLLHAHTFGHSQLTYSLLVNSVKGMFEGFFTAFLNMETLVILLDESEYVPLGKIPTQTGRAGSFTPKERCALVNGGTLADINNGLKDSVEELYGQDEDVTDGKKTPFAKYYTRYMRTRTLRKDFVRFMIRCLVDLLREKPHLCVLRGASSTYGTSIIKKAVYFDGISLSEYYSEDVSDTPLMARKRTRQRSISSATLPGTDPHEHTKHTMMRVCRIDCDEILRITSSETDRDAPFLSVQERVLSWLMKEDGDAVIFRGFQSVLKRPDMGESDIKIPYYIDRFAEMVVHVGSQKCSTYVSCWDTDSIPIILLSMVEMKLRGIYDCTNREHVSKFNIFLDIRKNGSHRALSAYGTCPDDTKAETTIKIVDMAKQYRSLTSYFACTFPEVVNPIETFCMFCIIMGTDYVPKPSGIGWAGWSQTFHAGGFLLLSKAIRMRSELDMAKRKYHLRIGIDYHYIEGFYNLVFRSKLKLGKIGHSFSRIPSDKRDMRNVIKKMEKQKLSDEKGKKQQIAKVQSLLERMTYFNLPRGMTERLVLDKYKTDEGIQDRLNYFVDNTGIADEEHLEWTMIMATLAKQRKQQEQNRADKQRETPELEFKKKAHISDMENELEIRAYARRAGWYFVYACFSPFVCMRKTTSLNCLASASVDNEHQERPSIHGFQPDTIYVPIAEDEPTGDEEDTREKDDIATMEMASLSHSSDGGLGMTDLYDSMLASERDKKRRKMKRTVSYSKRVCAPRNIHIVIS